MALYTNIKGPVNYTVVGNVTINNGIASGFGSNYNYIKSNTPLITDNNPWVAILKVNFGSSIPVTWRLFATEGGPTNAIGFLLGSNSSTQLYVWLAVEGYSGWKYSQVKGSLVLQTNTDYYLRMGWTGSVYYVDYSLDGINYTRDITINESIPMKNGSDFMTIGGTREYNSGSNTIIYLDETSININNVAWFGTSFSKVKLHSPTAIAYTKVGNPTITSDGVASGFTDKTDYLTLGAFNPGTNKWKFTTKVKIYDYATQISLIDRNSSTRCFQIVVRTTGKFRVNISTNGTSKANEVDGTHVVSVNTIYYLSFEYDGSKYYLKYSLDNINWVTDITINNSTKIYPVSTMCMGHSWYNSGTEKWNGEIYLRCTRFEIDGVTNDKYKLHALEGDYAIVDDKLVWANPNIYLQSSGTQYIDTGIKGNLETAIELKYQFTQISSTAGTGRIFGARKSGRVNAFMAATYLGTTQTTDRYGCGFNQTGVDTSKYVDLSTNIIKLSKEGYYINNTKYNFDGVATQEFTTPQNLLIFAYYQSSEIRGGSLGKCYYCKLWENNELIRHLVPVPTGLQIGDFTVPSNGMFDIVNQQFYPNQGTGTFTYGKDE